MVLPLKPASTPRLRNAATTAMTIPNVSDELPAERAPPPNMREIRVLRARIPTITM
jgi:hypothetical protein